ncbi:phage tail protein [Oryzobacter terrae]|uniref:phage tail protein n=1 Tax=Oryzobacter terrae TaxID=1620385 RepID=UPI00366C0307
MATATRHDAGLARSLTVSFGAVAVPGVVGVSGLGVARDAVEFREGNDPTGGVRRLPGRLLGGDVTLSRPLTTDQTFESWIRGPGPEGAVVATREVRIRFFDRAGSPVRGYRLVGAWPRRLEVTGSTLPGSVGLLELLVVSYDTCVTEA